MNTPHDEHVAVCGRPALRDEVNGWREEPLAQGAVRLGRPEWRGLTPKEDQGMPRYIQLYNWTDQGVRNAKESPNRIRQAAQALEQLGGKLIDISLTMGQYDLVGVVDAPNDEVVARFALRLAGLGNVRTTTLKAFSLDEFEQLARSL
jgi:uncharacterized protein with GYD domain